MFNDRGPNIQQNLFFIHINTKKYLQETSLCLHFPEQKKKGVRCSTIGRKHDELKTKNKTGIKNYVDFEFQT